MFTKGKDFIFKLLFFLNLKSEILDRMIVKIGKYEKCCFQTIDIPRDII